MIGALALSQEAAFARTPHADDADDADADAAKLSGELAVARRAVGEVQLELAEAQAQVTVLIAALEAGGLPLPAWVRGAVV